MKELEQQIELQNNEIKKLHENLQQLSGEVKHLNEQLTLEKMKNSNIPKQLEKIFTNDQNPILRKYKNQSSDLLNEFNNNKESKSIISRHLEDFMIKGEIAIGCSDCFLWSDVQNYVSMICETEKIVADKIEKQVREDYEDFSEWNDDNDSVKLTLIFNIFGISPDIIQKLASVNGNDFDADIFDVCSANGIDDWDSILDLGYIQMMLRNNALPCPKHFENCPVCYCSTPKELENLLREHELALDYNLLERKNINGSRFIAIGHTRWIKNCEEKIDEKAFRKAIQHVKKLHKTDDF